MFYYGYSPFSLVAGAAIDRFGAKRIIPMGAALVGCGALLFGTGNVAAANIGRFLQGAGGVFALVGAVYLVTRNFPASSAASFIGATQMFGMAGGLGGAVRCGAPDQARASLGAVLDLLRPRRAGDQRVAVRALAKGRAQAGGQRHRRLGQRAPLPEDGFFQPSIHPVRPDCRPAVHPHNHPRA